MCWWLAFIGEAAESQKLRDHVPAAVGRLRPVDRLAAKKVLRLAIGLPLRDEQGLSALLQQLYDPASPNYHQWLTPEQFAERFGPAEKDYQAVANFARAHGLTVTVRHPNRLVLDVEGAVSDIEKTLHVTLRVYPHPTEGRTFYAPDSEPMLDLAVPVLHVAGLDNYSLPHPNSRVKSPDNTPGAAFPPARDPTARISAAISRPPTCRRTSLTGSGQSVGLLQFDGYCAEDIASTKAKQACRKCR